MKDFIDFAHELADASRPIIRQYYRSEALNIITKDDETPVTLADRETEEKIRTMIGARFPDHGILGEEYGHTNADAEYTWVLDPVDGTKPFTLGRPTFACLIGLHHREHGFILGITDQAITGDRWVGVKGIGTTRNGIAVKAAPFHTLKQVRVSITNPMRLSPQMKKLHDALLPQVAFINYGADAHNFTGIADGGLHLSFEAGQAIYDIAAMIPMIEEVGGRITQFDGAPVTLATKGEILAASTIDLHTTILEMVKTL